MKEETKKMKQRRHRQLSVNKTRTENHNLGLKAEGVVSISSSEMKDPDGQCTIMVDPIIMEMAIKKGAAGEPEMSFKMSGGAIKAQTSAKSEYVKIFNEETRKSQRLEVELSKERMEARREDFAYYSKQLLKAYSYIEASAIKRLYLLTEEKLQNAWKNIISFATSLSIHMVKSDREIDKVKEEIAHEEQESRKVNIQEERNLAEEEEKLAAQRALNKHIECYGEYPDPKYYRDTYNLCVKHGLIPEQELKKEDEASEEA